MRKVTAFCDFCGKELVGEWVGVQIAVYEGPIRDQECRSGPGGEYTFCDVSEIGKWVKKIYNYMSSPADCQPSAPEQFDTSAGVMTILGPCVTHQEVAAMIHCGYSPPEWRDMPEHCRAALLRLYGELIAP